MGLSLREMVVVCSRGHVHSFFWCWVHLFGRTFVVWFGCFQSPKVVMLGQCVDKRIPGRRDHRIPPLRVWENGCSSAPWVLHAGAGPSDVM